MKSLNVLIDAVVNYLPEYVSRGGCICSVLDQMYMDNFLQVKEVKILNDLINEFIEIQFLDECIETSNYKLFSLKLQTLKD